MVSLFEGSSCRNTNSIRIFCPQFHYSARRQLFAEEKFKEKTALRCVAHNTPRSILYAEGSSGSHFNSLACARNVHKRQTFVPTAHFLRPTRKHFWRERHVLIWIDGRLVASAAESLEICDAVSNSSRRYGLFGMDQSLQYQTHTSAAVADMAGIHNQHKYYGAPASAFECLLIACVVKMDLSQQRCYKFCRTVKKNMLTN